MHERVFAGGRVEGIGNLNALHRGGDEAIVEGDVLGAVPMIVAVDVVEGENSVLSVGQIADSELSELICAGDSVEGQCCEGGVGESLG